MQQLGLEHFGHFGHLGRQQHLKQLGLKHSGQLGLQHSGQQGLPHSRHLGRQEHLIQLGLEQSGHFGRQILILQHLLEDLRRLGRIFLRRIAVVIFSISWINLQRWRM